MRKIAGIMLIAGVILSGCGRVITGSGESDDALAAFNAIVKANQDRKGYHAALKHWGLSLPGGGKFEWTKDTGAGEIDFAMVIPAEPFIRAGLDLSRLEGSGYVFKPAGVEDGEETPDLLLHPYNVSDKKENAQGSEDALRRILKQNNGLIRYRAETGQYRLLLSGGFEVLWAEKPGQDGGEIAFVIPLEPLVRAGLDRTKLEGFRLLTGPGADSNQLIEFYTL